MRKKFLMASVLVATLVAGSGAAVWQSQSQSALAKNKPAYTHADAKKAMTKYSAPNKNSSTERVRVSRIKEMNIVAEAAEVLNVLPIDIINEMGKGKTLLQVAKDKGLTEAEFNKKLTAADKRKVDDAVKNGVITKEHGDAIAAGRADRVKSGMQEKAMKAHTVMDMGN